MMTTTKASTHIHTHALMALLICSHRLMFPTT